MVYNTEWSVLNASYGVALYYAQARGIPQGNIVAIITSAYESIDAEAYVNNIATPISNYLSQHPNIKVIVLCYGIPFRISGTPHGSVDAALMLLGNLPLKMASLHAILQS